jgi:5-methylthioadenosine/S-adenosylhomocysteine deaminase
VTLHGARAVFAEDSLGSIEVGKRADMTLFDASGPEWSPGHDIPRTMVYSVDGRSVRSVIIDGRVVYENGKCVTMDSPNVISEARETGARIAHRLGLDARPRWPLE